MLSATIREDYFLLASVPAGKACELCPAGLRPVLTADRGFVCLAAVRLRDVRLFGVPVAGEAVCAGVLLITEYLDQRGRPCRGNCFLEGYTDCRLLAVVNRWLGVFRYAPVRLSRAERHVDLVIPGQLAARVDLGRDLPPPEQARMEGLLAGNQSGVLARGDRAWYVPLHKSHWRMHGHPAVLTNTSLLDRLGARLEFGFDTSYSVGRWSMPRPVLRPR